MSQKGKKQGTKAQDAYELVYSTDPIPEGKCSTCKNTESICVCRKTAVPLGSEYVVRIEKKGRGGKVVTLVERLPPHEFTLEKVCKFLKKSVGAGGTYYISDGMGIVEIQGERRQELLDILLKYK